MICRMIRNATQCTSNGSVHMHIICRQISFVRTTKKRGSATIGVNCDSSRSVLSSWSERGRQVHQSPVTTPTVITNYRPFLDHTLSKSRAQALDRVLNLGLIISHIAIKWSRHLARPALLMKTLRQHGIGICWDTRFLF